MVSVFRSVEALRGVLVPQANWNEVIARLVRGVDFYVLYRAQCGVGPPRVTTEALDERETERNGHTNACAPVEGIFGEQGSRHNPGAIFATYAIPDCDAPVSEAHGAALHAGEN